MFDLKPYFDSAQKANDEVQRIMGDMNAAFSKGTEEGKAEALALKPQLDAAQKAAKAANELYLSMRDAASTSEAASKFVPVPAAENPSTPATAANTMNRADFVKMSTDERAKFMRDGGTLVD